MFGLSNIKGLQDEQLTAFTRTFLPTAFSAVCFVPSVKGHITVANLFEGSYSGSTHLKKKTTAY